LFQHPFHILLSERTGVNRCHFSVPTAPRLLLRICAVGSGVEVLPLHIASPVPMAGVGRWSVARWQTTPDAQGEQGQRESGGLASLIAAFALWEPQITSDSRWTNRKGQLSILSITAVIERLLDISKLTGSILDFKVSFQSF